jgi:hypothetical protein
MSVTRLLRRIFRCEEEELGTTLRARQLHAPTNILEHWEPVTLALLPSFNWKRDSSVAVTIGALEQHKTHVYISMVFDVQIPLYTYEDSTENDWSQRLFHTTVKAEREPRSEDEYREIADAGWDHVEVVVFQWSHQCNHKTPSGDTVFVPRDIFSDEQTYRYTSHM